MDLRIKKEKVGTLLGLLSICNAMRSLILSSAVVSILCIKESDHLLKEEGEKGKRKREEKKEEGGGYIPCSSQFAMLHKK
jgi:hypothetical protein